METDLEDRMRRQNWLAVFLALTGLSGALAIMAGQIKFANDPATVNLIFWGGLIGVGVFFLLALAILLWPETNENRTLSSRIRAISIELPSQTTPLEKWGPWLVAASAALSIRYLNSLSDLTRPGLALYAGAWIVLGWTLWAVLPRIRISSFTRRDPDAQDLRIHFATPLEGCRVPTMFSNGKRAIFFRLWVRPPTGTKRTGCRGTLISISLPIHGMPDHWHSDWSAERLALAWATHSLQPETSIPLDDDHGHFLDVFFVTEDGEIGFGTPHFAIPLSLKEYGFVPGQTYLIAVSVVCDQSPAREVLLFMTPAKQWDRIEVWSA